MGFYGHIVYNIYQSIDSVILMLYDILRKEAICMGYVSLNLIIRFVLEIVLVMIFGYWGWKTHYVFSGPITGLLLPAVAAAIWGIFRVEEESGKGVIVVPGWLRLAYEFLLFVAATLMLYDVTAHLYAKLFLISWCIHYLFSYKRILRLLKIVSPGKNRNLKKRHS